MRALLALAIVAVCGCATTALETVQQPWHEVRTQRFVVWTHGDPAEAVALLVDLERFDRIARRTTSMQEREGAPPLQIFIARDAAALRAWTGQGRGVTGFFLPSALGNVAFVTSQGGGEAEDGEQSARHILFHEYTHYLIASNGAGVPSWYNEGFAEYLAATEMAPDGSHTYGCPPRYRTRWTERIEWLPMQVVMEADNIAGLMREGHGGFGRLRKAPRDAYLQSWYAVHYFNQHPALQQGLAKYLALWGSGTPSESALSQAFGVSYAQLDAVLRAHAAQEKLSCIRMRGAPPGALPVPEVRAISSADAAYRIARVLMAGAGDPAPIEGLLADALSREPHHADAIGALARVHLHKAAIELVAARKPDGELARAELLLKQADALDPDDPERLTIAGHVAAARATLAARRGGAADAVGAHVLAARRAYRKAVFRDPALAEALFGLGQTYALQDDGAEEGQVALEGAAYLLPLEGSVTLALGQLYLRRKQPAKALAPLEHSARWSRDARMRALAQALLQEAKKAL